MHKTSYLFSKIICLLVVCTLGASCAKPVIVPHDPAMERIVALVSSAVPESDIVTAIARIDLITSGTHYPAKAALLLKKSSYLRLELLPIMGPPDFFLTANPRELKILLPGKGEFYQGRPTGTNLSRFLPWRFDLNEIIAVLAGTCPPLTGEVRYSRCAEKNGPCVEMKAPSGMSQTIELESKGRMKKIERRDEAGNILYSAEFAEYEDGSPIAGKITINIGDGATSLTIRYSDLKIEKAKDLSVFDLPLPAGFKTVLLD